MKKSLTLKTISLLSENNIIPSPGSRIWIFETGLYRGLELPFGIFLIKKKIITKTLEY